MNTSEKSSSWKGLLTVIAISGLLVVLTNCAGNTPIKQQPGAQLWGDNCIRCHNIRPPANLTDAQWEVAVMHMRTRANLTAVEAEKIIEFLKASN
ncbi:MAG: cytochrome c [candidate division KSB1 bacterium]|nr:cytochrome c [candidate division KSB1 bacterium]